MWESNPRRPLYYTFGSSLTKQRSGQETETHKKKKELAPFDSLDELGPPLPPFLSEAKQSSERAKEPSNQVPGVSEPARNAPINGTGTHTQVSWIDSAPFWWHLPCPSPLIPLSPPLPYSSLPVRETAAV